MSTTERVGAGTLSSLIGLLDHGTWVDLSPRIENDMPRWPTHPPVVLHRTVTHEHDGYFTQTIFMPEHTGSHVDAPAHIHADLDDRTIDTFPPEFLIRPAKVVHLEGRDWQPGEFATADDVEAWERNAGERIEAGDVVLVNYGWLARHWRTDGRWKWYSENMPGMDESFADLMLARGIRAIGTDTIACGTAVVDGKPVPGTPPPVNCWMHLKMLRAGIPLMECLRDLDRLPSACLFVALPLHLKGGSGSPIRAAAFVPAA